MKIFGIILIVLGVVALLLPTLSFTRKEKILDLGPIEAVAEKRQEVPISPLLGVSSMAAGVALVLAAVVTGKK